MPTPPTNRGKKLPPEHLTRAEVRDLIAAASHRSTSGVRMRALIAVMVGAGLRLAETLDLEPRDVDTANGTIRVREGKGRKSATVGIDPWAAGHLDRWMDRRCQVGLTGRHRVFAAYEVGKVGQPLDPRYVRLALARLKRRAGIAKRVHPHGLRHSLAFDLAQQGVPMHAIQAQLRHASLAHTDRYVRHLLPAEVIALMRQRTCEEARRGQRGGGHRRHSPDGSGRGHPVVDGGRTTPTTVRGAASDAGAGYSPPLEEG